MGGVAGLGIIPKKTVFLLLPLRVGRSFHWLKTAIALLFLGNKSKISTNPKTISTTKENNNKSKDIHRSKDNCTSVTEGQAGRQSVNSVLQSGHFGDIGHLGDLDYSGDLDDHVDEHADLVHAVGHGQEDDGSKREVEEKGRPARRLHLRTCAKSDLYFFLFVLKNAQRVLDSISRICFQ